MAYIGTRTARGERCKARTRITLRAAKLLLLTPSAHYTAAARACRASRRPGSEISCGLCHRECLVLWGRPR